MTKIERSALVGFSTRQMYELVNDIESYPKFMQGCHAAEVISSSETEVVARLVLGKAGIERSFTTCNKLEPYSRMTMHLLEGPFSHFNAAWNFVELTPNACKVTLNMEFKFSGGLLGLAMEKVFHHSANNLVDAVVARANAVYGA